MSNPWFRVYAGLIDDPKFIRLGPEVARALLMTWCVACENNGRLPPIEDIAIKFRTTPARAQKLLDELRRSGFIDDDETGSTPHNWNARQYKSDVSTERVKRFRNGKRNVSSIVSETPPDTEQNRTEQTAPESAGNVYAFESGIIRLSEKDFNQWKTAFSCLDLPAELIALAPWAASQRNWYIAVSGALGKRNRDEKFRREAARNANNRPLTPDGKPWPDGII